MSGGTEGGKCYDFPNFLLFHFFFRAMVFRVGFFPSALGMSWGLCTGATELGFDQRRRGKRYRPCPERGIKKKERERILKEVPRVSERAVYYYYYYCYLGLGFLLFGGGVAHMSGKKAIILSRCFTFERSRSCCEKVYLFTVVDGGYLEGKSSMKDRELV